MRSLGLVLAAHVLLLPSVACFASDPPAGRASEELALGIPTTGADLGAWALRADPKAKQRGNTWEITVAERSVLLIFDEAAGRMRLMTPIVEAKELAPLLLTRMLQANFDSVLDARYALANGAVWSAFIHPLPSLQRDDFESGLRQVVVAAETFGSSFTSGAMVFSGGDSQREAEPEASSDDEPSAPSPNELPSSELDL